jgi:hypothetical protein
MLVANDLQPTAPVPGVPVETQADSMTLLRRMAVAPDHPHELPDQLVAWASSNSLSRADMAVATGFSLSEINDLIRETAERDLRIKGEALRERANRHMPHWQV